MDSRQAPTGPGPDSGVPTGPASRAGLPGYGNTSMLTVHEFNYANLASASGSQSSSSVYRVVQRPVEIITKCTCRQQLLRW